MGTTPLHGRYYNNHIPHGGDSRYSPIYQLAFEYVLLAEGGYSNHKADRGGETLFGLSRKAYPHLDFGTLTIEKAYRIYHRDYWQVCQCGKLPNVLAMAVFDAAVNHGARNAIEMLQRAVKAKPDGLIGPNTLAAINKCNFNDLLTDYLARRNRKYARIVMNDSSQAVFLLGWMHRITKLQYAIYQAANRYSWQGWQSRRAV
ncbi:peptidoglycan-binding protein [Shewanella sp. WXL01]|uniref:glycoside hydrolase family 108 protein n=1 Tax=Shewanella sp. WXL01 TaxID=2709721 RepID=UPI0014383149|nr:glycosyl hydrolase 108 family protein [Shewanella sp. WXL01]NKF51380.1 peptidoglycan-binding protein [Shewanella sp. WXL01]